MSLAVLAAGFCAAATGLHLATLMIAAKRIRRPGACVEPGIGEPPVSLLRPLCGIDNFAVETLTSSFRIDYPDHELIFCVARADDPVLPLVRRLIAAHPGWP